MFSFLSQLSQKRTATKRSCFALLGTTLLRDEEESNQILIFRKKELAMQQNIGDCSPYGGFLCSNMAARQENGIKCDVTVTFIMFDVSNQYGQLGMTRDLSRGEVAGTTGLQRVVDFH